MPLPVLVARVDGKRASFVPSFHWACFVVADRITQCNQYFLQNDTKKLYIYSLMEPKWLK